MRACRQVGFSNALCSHCQRESPDLLQQYRRKSIVLTIQAAFLKVQISSTLPIVNLQADHVRQCPYARQLV